MLLLRASCHWEKEVGTVVKMMLKNEEFLPLVKG